MDGISPAEARFDPPAGPDTPPDGPSFLDVFNDVRQEHAVALLAPSPQPAPDAGAGAAATTVLRGALRIGPRAAGPLAAAGTLLIPTNRQSQTTTEPVAGHPDLVAVITRAPGDLSGTVTICARGPDGEPGRALRTLDLDANGDLTVPPGPGQGAPLVLGHGRPGEGQITLRPDLAQSLDDQAAGNSGGTGRPPASGVRADGECDEDANLGATSARSRLPATSGHWTGEPGNSGWVSDNPAVQSVTGGEPIPFTNGRPDFTEWAHSSINVPHGVLTGEKLDMNLAYEEIAKSGAIPGATTVTQVREYLKSHGLTVHHVTDTCLQIVPEALNGLIPHIGAAADLRFQNRMGGSQ